MSYLGKMDINGKEHAVAQTLYGTCDSGSAVAVKTVICDNFDGLIDGVNLRVFFKNTNTNSSPKMNVNSLGEIPIVRSSSDSEVTWMGESFVSFTYKDNVWYIDNPLRILTVEELTSEYPNTKERTVRGDYLKDGIEKIFNSMINQTGNRSYYYTTCDSAEDSREKHVTIDVDESFRLKIGTLIMVKMLNGNTATVPRLYVDGLSGVVKNGLINNPFDGNKPIWKAGDILLLGCLEDNGGDWLILNSERIMIGASSSSNGLSGLVPAPKAGEENSVLMGDGTWSDISNIYFTICTSVSDSKNKTINIEDEKFELKDNTMLVVNMRYANTASGDLNLLINAGNQFYNNKLILGGSLLHEDISWIANSNLLLIYQDNVWYILNLYGNGSGGDAKNYANTSKSYAIGGTDTRIGEDEDNSKYYKQLSETEADRAKTEADRAKTEADRAKAIVGVDIMVGATSSSNGLSGLVPAPKAGEENSVLMGDGTWSDIIPFGGRNLVLDSEDEKIINTKNTASFVFIESYQLTNYGKEILTKPNTLFNVSFDMKCESYESMKVTVRLYGETSRRTEDLDVIISREYNRYYLKGKNIDVDDLNRLWFGGYVTNDGGSEKVYIKNVKLELGTIPTDYMPAPEDLESKIEEIVRSLIS